MGAQQAMQDTTSAMPALLSLAKSKAGPTNQEVAKAVAEYEVEMIPRAFYWVKSSGNGDLLKFSKLQLFIMGRVMALAGVYVWIRKLLGWKPVDEVPEFN